MRRRRTAVSSWTRGLVVATLAVSNSCTPSSRSQEWYEEQRLLISVVVLVDVVDEDGELERGSRRDLCVSFGDDIETPSREPDPRLVTMLRESLQNVHPLSECQVTAEGVTHVSNGGKAVLLGVASPVWERDDFVKVKAWRLYNAFNATSWTYTLNREEDLWRIGVVKLGKVASSDDGTRSPSAS